MSIISAVHTYIKSYADLKAGAPVWVNALGSLPSEYSIVPLPGEKIVETYINDGSMREFPFALQSTESTADDATRIDTTEFYEAFAEWLESQTQSGVLPVLDAGKTAVSIEALGWGYLIEEGQSDTAIYQIQCKLTYEQQP